MGGGTPGGVPADWGPGPEGLHLRYLGDTALQPQPIRL
jgi:hypothetical protein